jgi:hypothetical protein
MRIKTFVIGAILSAASASIAQAQAPENLRVVYDECGVRSLAWDPVDGATNYLVSRDFPPTCPYGCCNWSTGPVGSTTSNTSRPLELFEPTFAYYVTALNGKLDLGTTQLFGPFGWAGPLSASCRAIDTLICPNQNVELDVDCLSRTPAIFTWTLNGSFLATTNEPHLTTIAPKHGPLLAYAVQIDNSCESILVAWPAGQVAEMPESDVLAWQSYDNEGGEVWDWRRPGGPCPGDYCHRGAEQSSFAFRCNHGDLSNNGFLAHASARSTRLNGDFFTENYCASGDRRTRVETWTATLSLKRSSSLHVIGNSGASCTVYGWGFPCYAAASITIRRNGVQIWSTGDPHFDQVLKLMPGTIQIQAIAITPPANNSGWDFISNASVTAQGVFEEHLYDCNGNLVADEIDLSSGTSADIDHNDVPDECQADCNFNLLPDAFEIASNLVPDSNTDGIPDTCQGAVMADFTTDNLGAPSGTEVRSHAFDHLPLAETPVTLTLDAVGDLNNPSEWIDVRLNGDAPRRFFATTGHSCPDIPDRALITLTREEFNAIRGVNGELTVTLECPVQVDGTECKNAGMTQLHLQYIGIDTKTGDCNNNQRLDIYEVQDGTAPDCNANRVPDSCDIARGAENDCNSSGIPDSCEIVTTPTLDCNTNGMIDSCDLATRGTEIDCDQNGRIDSCQVAETPGIDCNGNLRPDTCDVAGGTSADIDANGVPDECQTVTVPGRYGSIQAAIDAAPANEMRIISVAAGIYSGPIAFNGKSVIVRGAGAASTVIDGASGQTLSVVRFTGGEPAMAAIEGFTIRGGATGTPYPGAPQFLVGGGIFSINSAANVRDCVLEQNIAAFGAGAYIKNSTGRIERCEVRGNNAGADGGGLQLYGGSPVVEDTVIEGNVCNSRGAGLHVVEGTPTLRRTTVLNNQSSNVVGGVSWVPANSSSAFLTIDRCSVTNNGAALVQGGIGIADDPGTTKMSLQSTTVCNNLPRPNVAGRWIDLGGNTVCDCVGDFNVDGVVNGADLGLMLSSWGPCGANCPYDLNADGQINGADLGLVLSAWGVCGG